MRPTHTGEDNLSFIHFTISKVNIIQKTLSDFQKQTHHPKTGTPKNTFDQISEHLVTQSIEHMKLTSIVAILFS